MTLHEIRITVDSGLTENAIQQIVDDEFPFAEETSVREQFTNQDDLTEEQVEDAYEVLEVLRDAVEDEDTAAIANDAHYWLQEYDNGSNWKRPEP